MAHLRALLDDGVHDPVGGITAFAVTGALRQWFQSGDEEELEYAATSDAAFASLRLLAADSALPRRRVVIAADINSSLVHGLAEVDRASVRIEGPLKMSQVESILVDGDDAIPDLTAAVEALPRSEAEDPDADAEFLVSQAEGHELLWYAASEIAELLLVDG